MNIVDKDIFNIQRAQGRCRKKFESNENATLSFVGATLIKDCRLTALKFCSDFYKFAPLYTVLEKSAWEE